MSIQQALEFIRHHRQHSQSHAALGTKTESKFSSLEDCVRSGQESGLNFTENDLRQAHLIDWQMRWLRLVGDDQARS